MSLPRLAITMGDVAGIGPETIARALTTGDLAARCRPVVVGCPQVLRRALALVGSSAEVVEVAAAEEFASRELVAAGVPGSPIVCWNPATVRVDDLPAGKVAARAGRAAYDWLVAATRAALSKQVEAIVTAPLNKYALRAGGVDFPGHTEILAHECGVRDSAMMLYLPPGMAVRAEQGLGVAHVTLHTSIASVPGLLSVDRIEATIGLLARFMTRVMGKASGRAVRIGVCALNPHAGEDGLFGDEEARLIAPGVARAVGTGIDAQGPFPADTLLKRACDGEFDGVVAMYHDQGHIAIKLVAFNRAVNVTLGLPIVRTSPSHGTAFDIAWQGQADAGGLVAAADVALRLAGSD
jgi:4-phospho-D-threonate 3-dehydrogenase / 4-phospho-D-erythronate 3-dehydrogenase